SDTISAKPMLMPSTCGTVRAKPKFAPEARTMVLLGPGVIDDTSAKPANAAKTPVPAASWDTSMTDSRAFRESVYGQRTVQYRYTLTEIRQYRDAAGRRSVCFRLVDKDPLLPAALVGKPCV